MATLSLNGKTYRVTRKMPLFRQLAVGTKLAPLLASGLAELAPMLAAARRDGLNNLGDFALDKLGAIITPVTRELAKMTDDDRRLIVEASLDLIDVRDDGKEGWARIWNAETKTPMFDEINGDLGLTLRLVALALQETFASFLPASLYDMFAGAQAA